MTRGRNLAGVQTPVSSSGLRQYDRLPAADAVAAAWGMPGRRPDVDADVHATIEALNPVLARALDRLVRESKRA
jgi:hypothetical protein